MRPKDMILEQISHRETETIPYTICFEGDVQERLDTYYGGPQWRDRLTPYLEVVSIIEADAEVEIAPGFTKDAFGSVWRKDVRPFHLETGGLAQPSFEGYDFPEPDHFIREDLRPQVLKKCERYRDSFLAAGFGFGLFERTWAIRGFQNALIDAAAEPDFYEELLERIFRLHLAFIEALAILPVDGILFSDDWGEQRGVIIGPERWRRLIKPRLAKLYAAAHAAGKLTLSHCCGNIAEIMPDLIEIGLDVLESIQPEAMNPYELKKRYGDKITLWGGLGSQSTLAFGTPAEIKREVRRLCAEMGRGGGYILAPAKALQPDTATENAAAVVESFTCQSLSGCDFVSRRGFDP